MLVKNPNCLWLNPRGCSLNNSIYLQTSIFPRCSYDFPSFNPPFIVVFPYMFHQICRNEQPIVDFSMFFWFGDFSLTLFCHVGFTWISHIFPAGFSHEKPSPKTEKTVHRPVEAPTLHELLQDIARKRAPPLPSTYSHELAESYGSIMCHGAMRVFLLVV